MKNLYKVLFIIREYKSYHLFIFLIFNVINFLLEFSSILSLPLFAATLLNNELPQSYLNFFLKYFDDKNLIFYSSAFVLLSFLLKNSFLLFYAWYLQKFLQKVRSGLSKKFFNFYFDAFNSNTKELLPSVMARNVTTSVPGFYAYFESLNTFVKDVTAIITVSLIIMFVNFKIAISIILVFSIVIISYSKVVRPKIKKKARENQNLVSNFNQMIIETFEALKDIKVFQKEKIVSNLFNSKIDTYEKNIFFFRLFEKFPRIFLEILSIFSILFFSVIFYIYTDSILSAIPIIVLVVVSAIRLIPAFSGITTTLFYLRAYEPSVQIIYDQIKQIKDLETKSKFIDKNTKSTFKDNLDTIKNYIVIDKISHSYNEKNQLLKEISLSIPKNSLVSIAGPSGSGKSTLQNILMGFIEPDQGNIYFENKNININYESWIKKISFVSQKVFLFDDTIEKNICLNFDNGKIDYNRLNKSVEIAELKQKILSLDNGYNELVGSSGSKLSGGERQRVALARAIYKKSDIIFFDEFTSNLDEDTENKIISNIKNYLSDKTIIMITHRPEIAAKSDLILRLNKGSYKIEKK